MRNEDILTGVGSICSGILAFFSWLWSIPILQFAFTFILGTLVTYFIQGRLQDRVEKRKITRENIEKIYGPLVVELQAYKDHVVDALESPSSQNTPAWSSDNPLWTKIKTFPEFFSIPMRIREEMEQVTQKVVEIVNSLYEIRRITDSYLIEALEVALKKYYKEQGSSLSRESGNQTLYVTIKSRTGANYELFYLHDSVLLDKDHIAYMKHKFPDALPNQVHLHIVVKNKIFGQPDISVEIPVLRIQGEMRQILQDARNRVVKDKAISKILEERKGLSDIIDRLLPMIKKYIERHYPIEDI